MLRRWRCILGLPHHSVCDQLVKLYWAFHFTNLGIRHPHRDNSVHRLGRYGRLQSHVESIYDCQHNDDRLDRRVFNSGYNVAAGSHVVWFCTQLLGHESSNRSMLGCEHLRATRHELKLGEYSDLSSWFNWHQICCRRGPSHLCRYDVGCCVLLGHK